VIGHKGLDQQLLATEASPGRPEVEEYYLAFQIGNLPRLALQVRQVKLK